MTPDTFADKKKLFQTDRFEVLIHLAARNTWGKHPDELLGEGFHRRMLLDQAALEAWVIENQTVHF